MLSNVMFLDPAVIMYLISLIYERMARLNLVLRTGLKKSILPRPIYSGNDFICCCALEVGGVSYEVIPNSVFWKVL